jgi:hypothetical protein
LSSIAGVEFCRTILRQNSADTPGPEVTFGPTIRQGANASFIAKIEGGRWVRVTQPLAF